MFSMKICCVEDDRAPVLGGAVVGGVCWRHQVRVSLHLPILEYQVRVSLHLPILEYQVRCHRMLLVYTRGEAIFMKALCGSDKIEPAQASQFITRTIQAYFPGLIHRFNGFPMEVQELLYQMFMSNHRFTHHSDEAQSRLVWTTTARSNFKHLLYNARKNAEKEKELKQPPTFQEVFDKTHKKKGMDQYISKRAQEVAESYSQQMIEKYAGEEE
ncbi:hypothetical protein Taro_000367 [Colocasia esculenta]|uniref:Uncharacterized protein n=1 Tax=Colocasia esculenta TaxID=4460 RepID=A0A843TCT0_COLES|nr:hypothetical protein [Colocasia esculenta]